MFPFGGTRDSLLTNIDGIEHVKMECRVIVNNPDNRLRK